ncbi:sensor histidine kinase [Accumulibacter sp.]|uniref:sensor histidine kinase n=1 Tax=Accumulibacter sp. TaxID=2053492 RepID=UPI0025F3C405|nr:PAS domain-containing sensor histidine kinase [Accumulibacter sp.]MCM8596772.1 ATP-binding protein [Accumulibacter sp.]MCM8624694.1 ATP-binding protein [Accumulibacter sp.]MDS4050920.1 ATP-binding protein [Accumulibacter sp.]
MFTSRSGSNGKGWLAVAIVSAGLVGVLDYLTGYELRLGALYLVPVALATWKAGRTAGLAIALASCACWVISFSSSHGYAHPELFYWDGAVMGATLLAFVVLLAKLRQALANADERFVRVLNELHAAIYVADDQDGRILYANPRFSRLLEADPASLPDSPPGNRKVGVPDHRPGGRGDADFGARGFESFEYRGPASGRWYLMQAGPIPWLGGRTARLHLITDVSDRRHAQRLRRENQDMLHRSQRLAALSEATAALAHEINQPLMAIASYSDASLRLLESGTPAREELVRALKKSRDQAIRAGNILARMRDFVRRKRPRRVPCDLNAIVREALELIDAHLEGNGIVSSLSLADNLPRVLADPFLVEQVIVNLLDNAVDALRPLDTSSRRLTVSTTRQSDGMLRVSIADLGGGVPPSISRHLGTPFRSTKAQGLGLGLSICRSVVEAHGGRLWHTANPEGGAIFHFTIAPETP